MKKRALISVTDKTNLIPFVKGLIERGYEIVSTGGTYNVLKSSDISCKRVDELTSFPEIFDGRVKTLHPLIHGGLLGIRDNEKHILEAKNNQIEWFDILVINLYRFKETLDDVFASEDDIIEKIDIGGPAMIRSGAKNHKYVTVVTEPADYDEVLRVIDDSGEIPLDFKKSLAAKAFRLTAQYDAWIAKYLTKEDFPNRLTLTYSKKQELRYGENPHQSAAFYINDDSLPYSLATSVKLHGKELSYNNIQDANCALTIISEFEDSCCVALKHMNPCGIGCSDDIYKAWQKAYDSDPVSIFGGIVAFNRELDLSIAKELADLFIELVLAPSFEKSALELLSKKKNLRILTYEISPRESNKQIVSVEGGILIQDKDDLLYQELYCVTETKPSEDDINNLKFAYKAVKHVKSNAIVIADDFKTLGIGAGQMNRVGACQIALDQAKEKAKGAYLASDAFFPMADSVLLAAKAGIKAIIQPGGSIKDQESIDVCNEYGMIMVYTKMRHFKH